MTRSAIGCGAFAAVAALLAAVAGYRAFVRDRPAGAPSPAVASATPPAAEAVPPADTRGFLHGRITTVDGATYEGRLRWGRDQEAFWGDYFNGAKHENRWLARLPPELRPTERVPFEVLGFKILERERPVEVRRQLVARFGEIARIEAHGKQVRVTLKSGTVYDLDRFEASDLDDGVRVWDRRRGVVDLDSLRIRTVELLPGPATGDAPARLHGTVRTAHGDFAGFVGWNRDDSVGSDTLDGYTSEGELSLRFDTLRSIARRSEDSSVATLLDGREVVLSGTAEAGEDSYGIFVDDLRYGRVLIPWDAFERVDFSLGRPSGSGPAYGDFPPGRALTGSVTTRAGVRLAGRLVYDLDESETTDTLDAEAPGVDYTIPFGRIASLLPSGRVTLHSGETLQLERAGDLGEKNAGVLVFVDGRDSPEYVPWAEVRQVEFDRPPAMYPSL